MANNRGGGGIRKMDLPRALGTLGFSTARALEAETELEKRRALIDKALFNCTQDISRGNRNSAARANAKANAKGNANKDKINPKAKRKSDAGNSSEEANLEDGKNDVRLLHEAYQFLIKKYIADRRSKQQDSGSIVEEQRD